MNQVFQVFRFEVQARLKVPAAALVVGLLALAAPHLPQGNQIGIDTVQSVTALFLAAAFSLATAFGFGGAILAGPLATGRESFFLSRPLGLFRLWLGRFLAVCFLTIGTGFLALLPALLFVPDEPVWSGLFTRFSVPVVLGVLITLMTGAAVFRLLMVARSIWALGVPVAMIFVFWLWRESVRLVLEMGMINGGLFAALFVGPLLLAFLAASVAAATRGRSDLGRAALVGGTTACSLLVALVLLQWAGLSWLNAATPADVVRIGSIMPAPEGSWVLANVDVERVGIRFGRTFLLNTETGAWSTEWQMFGNGWMGSFSQNGRRVVLVKSESFKEGADTVLAKIVDLGGPDDLPRTCSMLPVAPPAGIALSPSGTKAISCESDRFRLWDVAGARVLAQATRDFSRPEFQIDESGEAWIFDGGSDNADRNSFAAYRLRPGEKEVKKIWEQGGISPKHPPQIGGPTDADVVFFLIEDPDTGSLSIVVNWLRTGEILWSTNLDSSPYKKAIYPVDERSVILITWEGERPCPATLSLIREDGPVWSRDIGVAEWAVMGSMPDPQTMVVAITRPGLDLQTSLVDLATGVVSEFSKTELMPAVFLLGRAFPRPGSPGARLFIRSHSELLILNQAGTLEPVRFGAEGRIFD